MWIQFTKVADAGEPASDLLVTFRNIYVSPSSQWNGKVTVVRLSLVDRQSKLSRAFLGTAPVF